MHYLVKGVEFAWDDNKAVSNVLKHGIHFEQACEAFFDPFLRVVDATKEDFNEGRDAVIGYSDNGRLLFVVHVEKGRGFYRIISARRATAKERRNYEEG